RPWCGCSINSDGNPRTWVLSKPPARSSRCACSGASPAYSAISGRMPSSCSGRHDRKSPGLAPLEEDPMSQAKKARLVGFNHIAIEVGDIDAALAFYGRLFDFELRSRSESTAFIDLGDQFIALRKGRTQSADDGRHFGLVVDSKEV